MKNLADLQLTTATDSASKSSITKQVNISLNWFDWFVHVTCTTYYTNNNNTNYFAINSWMLKMSTITELTHLLISYF